ncbi:MAG: hypothetical protein H0X37_06835 [Herpetosiphonaceae bacterium]|nr:hypothetical protein [Herpetosiphonaceae bacterium]
MKRTRALPWVIDILDDGLRLYRRYWSSFALATAALIVPISLLSFLVNALVINQLGSGWGFVGSLVVALLGIPFSSYMVAVLSRMAAQAASGRTPSLRSALRMSLIRVLGMSCYAVVFTLVASLCFGVGGVILLCGTLAITFRLVRQSFFGLSLSPFFALAGGLALFAYVLLFSAVAMSTIYAVQAFAIDTAGFGDSITRLNDFLFYRTRRNLLCFIIGGAIFATMLTAYTGTISFGVAQLAQSFFGQPLFFQGITGQAILTVTGAISAVILMPPMPIWMALLYLRIKVEREGAALEQRITAWTTTSPH